MHAKEPHRPAVPVRFKQATYLPVKLGIKLSCLIERSGAGDRSEIFVAELELNSAGEEMVFTEAPPNHLGQVRQRGPDLFTIDCVLVKRVLVTDRLGRFFLADLAL